MRCVSSTFVNMIRVFFLAKLSPHSSCVIFSSPIWIEHCVSTSSFNDCAPLELVGGFGNTVKLFGGSGIVGKVCELCEFSVDPHI